MSVHFPPTATASAAIPKHSRVSWELLRVAALLLALIAPLSLAACDGGKTTIGVPTGVPPAIVGPHIVSTKYPTDDLVVATLVATDAPYTADPTGVKESGPAIQQALDDCHTTGGGVVWLPVGKYKVSSSVYIPPHCTLRGDWRDPDVGAGAYGSVILATVPSGGKMDPGLFRISGSAGVNGLTVYYPNQSIANPVPYPFTFEILGTQVNGAGYMAATVERVTLLDSYRGISAGMFTTHELHTIRNVRGTALLTGLYLQDSADISHNENITFGNTYWASLDATVSPAKPTEAQIDAWTRAHVTGMEMGGLDRDQFVNLSFSDDLLGIALVHGRRAGMTGSLVGITIKNSHVALYLTSANIFAGFGLNIANSTLQANQVVQGSKPVAVEVIGDNPLVSLLFTNVTLGGGADVAALIGGDVYAAFMDCTFDDWSGPAAISATRGTVAVEGATFLPQLSASKKGIQLKPGVSSATILGSAFTGPAADLLDDTSGAPVIRQDTGFQFVQNQLPTYIFHPLPRPATTHFFNVRSAPYNALGNGSGDDTAAIQKALNDAGQAGGGTVYLPAGFYAIHGHLVVPGGVELRGSEDVPHRTMVLDGAQGTVLFAYEGKATATPDTAPPLILLNGEHAGIRGLGVHYPEQPTDSAQHIVAYPWTIRGKGMGVYVFDIAFTNAYQGIDFATYPTNGHYIGGINGYALKTGIRVGNSTEGWVENVMFNTNAWGRAEGLPGKLDIDSLPTVAVAYSQAHERAFVVADGAQNEHLVNDGVYGAQTGVTFEGSAHAVAINLGVDGTTNSYAASGSGNLTLLNIQGCGCGLGGVGLAVSGGGTVSVYNILTLVDYLKAVSITSGTFLIAGAAFNKSGAAFLGGAGAMEGASFQQSGLQVVVEGANTTANLWGNVGQGGFTDAFFNGALQLYSGNIPR